MKSKFKGMMNPYSLGLLTIIILSLVFGLLMLFVGSWWGLPVLIPAALLSSGFRILSPGKDGNPREVGLLSFLGNRLDYVVEGLTLVCDQFGFDLVGLTTIQVKKFEFEFRVESVRCAGGVRVGGPIKLSVIPDVSTAQSGWDWYDIGQSVGFCQQAEQIADVGTQQIVACSDDRTYKWVESHPVQIALELLQRIVKIKPLGGGTDASIVGRPEDSDEDESDDTRGLGCKIAKLQVSLKPLDPKVVTADEDREVELAQRLAETEDTKTINGQVQERIDFYKRNGLPNPDPVMCRAEVVYERAMKYGIVKVVSGGGKNLNINEIK